MDPTTGDRFFLEWPDLNVELFQRFVAAFAPAWPDRLNLLLLDKSGAPTSPRLPLPENVRRRCLPPYGPELNPSERVWRDLKDDGAWPQFTDLTAQQDDLGHLLQADEAATLPSLAGYPYLVEVIHALCV